jgi:hypothetical protein
MSKNSDLIDFSDHLGMTLSLVNAVHMGCADIDDQRQRDAMETLLGMVEERLLHAIVTVEAMIPQELQKAA